MDLKEKIIEIIQKYYLSYDQIRIYQPGYLIQIDDNLGIYFNGLDYKVTVNKDLFYYDLVILKSCIEDLQKIK